MRKTVSIVDAFAVLRKKWLVILISVLVGIAVFGLVSAFLLPKIYTSSISLYVNNGTVSVSGSDVNLNDLNASIRLVNTYIVILTDEDILKQAAERMGGVITSAELRNVIRMNSVNQTEVLQISASTTDPELSAQICNTMAELAPEVLQRVVKAGSVEPISAAQPAAAPWSPNVTKNILLGGAIGLLVSAAACLMVFLLDNRVKGEEDLREYIDFPVLGEIPSFLNKGGASRDD